jgi:hypothetical protein
MRFAAAVHTSALGSEVRRKFQPVSRLLTESARHVLRYWLTHLLKLLRQFSLASSWARNRRRSLLSNVDTRVALSSRCTYSCIANWNSFGFRHSKSLLLKPPSYRSGWCRVAALDLVICRPDWGASGFPYLANWMPRQLCVPIIWWQQPRYKCLCVHNHLIRSYVRSFVETALLNNVRIDK